MTSQLNVDTIVDKAGSGGTNVKVANTSTYVGEGGSGTQNTVQGLQKHWGTFGMDDAGIDDSFNMSSATDIQAGGFTVSLTNAMNNALFTTQFHPLYYNGNGTSIVKYNWSGLTAGATTSSAGLYCWRTDTGATVDSAMVHSNICGDLA